MDDKTEPAPLPVNMLWVGGSLSLIEQLSAQSFLDAGHKVVLHTYEGVGNVPENVELADANLVMDYSLVQRLRERKSGSYALASDYFRYALQLQNAGLWADMDIICLKAVPKRKQTIMGWQRMDSIASGLLYLDHKLPITSELLGLFKEGYIPPWVPRKHARKMRLKQWLPKRRICPAIMPWGTYGPEALTALAYKHGIAQQAEPISVFYPLEFSRATDIFDPNISLDSFVRENSLTIHLWNEALRRAELKDTRPHRNSPLGKLATRFGL